METPISTQPTHWVLIVEPNEKYAFLMQRYTEQISLTPTTVACMQQALDLAHAHPPLAVFMDSILAEGGFDVFLNTLRGNVRFEALPVLVYHWSHETIAPMKHWEPIEFIEKPVSFNAFTRALKRLGILSASYST